MIDAYAYGNLDFQLHVSLDAASGNISACYRFYGKGTELTASHRDEQPEYNEK